MESLLRLLHIFAVALWFGSVAFFSVAGLLIFRAFEEASLAEPRDAWLPLVELYDKAPPTDSGFPDPLRKEQGSRAAGVAVSRIFPFYYALQLGCGVVALTTAVLLPRGDAARVHRWRIALAALALLTVAGGWWLEKHVADLRVPRNAETDTVLRASNPTQEQVARARQARAEFGKWHGVSLLQNLATLVLTIGLMGLIPSRRVG